VTRGQCDRTTGQAMVEFLVISATVVFALFFPYLQGRCVATLLLHALLESFRAGSYLVSIL
jgi:hypothetical protein